MLFRLTALALLLILTAMLAICIDYVRFVATPLNLSKEIVIDVQPGMTQNGLLRQWLDEGLISTPRDRYWLRVLQSLNPEQAHHILAGEYLLRPGRTLVQSLGPLQQGQVLARDFTIIEGWNFRQLRAALQAQEGLAQTLDGLDDEAVMAAIGRPGEHPEGRFLPETYAWIKGSRDQDLLIRAAQAMDRELQNAWQTRVDGLPLSEPYQALILASIIEKETAVIEEMPLIAGVFVQRLEIGMRLQTDPTVIYGLGERFDGNLRRVDLRTDTPYNTYTRHGLPPTPIAMPGVLALRAAVNPQRSDKYYFVSRGDGTHHFSATLPEHNAAVRKYQLGGR